MTSLARALLGAILFLSWVPCGAQGLVQASLSPSGAFSESLALEGAWGRLALRLGREAGGLCLKGGAQIQGLVLGPVLLAGLPGLVHNPTTASPGTYPSRFLGLDTSLAASLGALGLGHESTWALFVLERGGALGSLATLPGLGFETPLAGRKDRALGFAASLGLPGEAFGVDLFVGAQAEGPSAPGSEWTLASPRPGAGPGLVGGARLRLARDSGPSALVLAASQGPGRPRGLALRLESTSILDRARLSLRASVRSPDFLPLLESSASDALSLALDWRRTFLGGLRAMVSLRAGSRELGPSLDALDRSCSLSLCLPLGLEGLVLATPSLGFGLAQHEAFWRLGLELRDPGPLWEWRWSFSYSGAGDLCAKIHGAALDPGRGGFPALPWLDLTLGAATQGSSAPSLEAEVGLGLGLRKGTRLDLSLCLAAQYLGVLPAGAQPGTWKIAVAYRESLAAPKP